MKETVVELFNDYKKKLQSSQAEKVSDSSQLSQITQASSEINILRNKKRVMKSYFKKYKVESGFVWNKKQNLISI